MEAIRSKLSSQNIIEVREEDLIYFKNLTFLDLSDNSVAMSSLKNLTCIEQLDLSNNKLDFLQIHSGSF